MLDSYFMFHEGDCSLSGTEKQVRSAFIFGQRLKDRMLDIYVEALKDKPHRGKYKKRSRKWIRNWLIKEMNEHEEVYLTAEESVELGFADEVFGAEGIYDWSKLVSELPSGEDDE